jgi:hypothetical protein
MAEETETVVLPKKEFLQFPETGEVDEDKFPKLALGSYRLRKAHITTRRNFSL